MRILVVEDQKDIRELLKSNLEAECFAVDTAEDGEVGSYLARSNTYDCIIMDYVMPKLDGCAACKEMRSNNVSTPIIILSVKSEPLTKAEVLDSGADDYLTKPFSFEELKARIRALLRRPAQVVDNVLEIDDLTLDTRGHSVKRGDRDIYLTRKEFMLLEYLLRNKRIVLSRGNIMEHVWDMNMDTFSNTIESHILSLRKKVEFPNALKLIHTIPGMGYKIDLKK